eukprot:3110387-Ditylum_brightwellii.AAC.1
MMSDKSLLGALPACLWTDQCNTNIYKSSGVGSVVVQKRGFESLYSDGGSVIEGNQAMNFNQYMYEVIGSRKSVNCLAATLNSKQHSGVNCIRSLIDNMMDRLRLGYMHKSHVAKEYNAAMSQATM